VQQFFKNAAEVKDEETFSSPTGDETLRAILRHTEIYLNNKSKINAHSNILPHGSIFYAKKPPSVEDGLY
jgi:hypothetical protein